MPKRTKYVEDKIQEDKDRLLAELEKMPVVEVACKRTGICRATYYRWINEDKAFSQSARIAQIEGIKLINDAMESTLISLALENRSMGAIRFWLENRHADYKQNKELERSRKLKNNFTKLSRPDIY
ncbi:MAG: hypothetical protein AAB443_02115 [Patescibacteria group bacterium]